MIRTVADLLSGIIRDELPKLDDAPVKHAPTIGDMYEGLSSDVLNRALPDGLGLRVVSGFARDGHGRLSGQLDCMVVRGEGERLPYTGFVHDSRQRLFTAAEGARSAAGSMFTTMGSSSVRGRSHGDGAATTGGLSP
ncbi:DUF6602 domain-containing protein [Streptomyces sp. NPDC094048]|uniref:DUF6602 domain-containing protein n=1 Tax=unclassified Streptomyces TaxID=2593676 RepID=UPI0033183B9A